MPDPKRDESMLPRVWVDADQNGLRLTTPEEYGAAPYKGWFFLSFKNDRMMPIGWRQVEYCQVSELEAAQRRIAELESGIERIMGTIHKDSQYHEVLDALLKP